MRRRSSETRGDKGERERKGRGRKGRKTGEKRGRERMREEGNKGRREGELNHLNSEGKHCIRFVRGESLMPALVEQCSNHHRFFGFSLCSTSFG